MGSCPTCHAGWTLRALEDTELFVRAACACERRRACPICRDPVTCVVVEADGVTVDAYACAVHGYEVEDVTPVPPPRVELDVLDHHDATAVEQGLTARELEPGETVRCGCGDVHAATARRLFTLVHTRRDGRREAVHRTACPVCDSGIFTPSEK